MGIYEDDKLERKEFVDKIINFVNEFSNDKNLTCLLNGQFGSGKSTVLNFLKQQIESEGRYNCLLYNVWKNNFFDNPLIPLLDCFNGLRTKKIKAGAVKIIKNFNKIILSTFAKAHSVDLTSLVVNENIFDEFNAYKNAIIDYKKLLKEAACKEKKIVMLVDELDRCLPEYQIKVLETIYHLLDIPNLIIIIAIDKNQLHETIKQKLGENLNIYGYLTKFIDHDFELPSQNDLTYITSLITINNQEEVISTCIGMYNKAGFAVRDSEKAIRELNLLCSNKVDHYWVPVFINLVLVIKKVDYRLYLKHFTTCPNKTFYYKTKTLKETKYNDFLVDIENNKTIKNIINELIVSELGKNFMLHLINYFYSIKHINVNDLTKYLKWENLQSQLLHGRNFSKPNQMQTLLNRISLLS